jgi:hypothetical protein
VPKVDPAVDREEFCTFLRIIQEPSSIGNKWAFTIRKVVVTKKKITYVKSVFIEEV